MGRTKHPNAVWFSRWGLSKTASDYEFGRAPNPAKFAQPGLSRSNGGHPQREDRFGSPSSSMAGLTLRLQIWICLGRFDVLKGGCPDLGGFGAR